MKDNEKDIIDYGEWTVPTSWDQITLKQYQEIEKLYEDKDKRFDVRECLHIFTNKSIDEINALPLEFVDSLMNNLVFLKDKPEEKEPTNKVIIDGEAYIINTQNKLKVGEYVASDAVLKSDRHNYAAILAVLARKAGEEYDSKFENESLDDRIKMFEQVPVTDVLPVIGFFFNLVHSISDTFPIVFKYKGRNRPHSQQYRDFSEKWGNLKTLYEIADEKIEKVGKVTGQYLNDYMQFLSYLIEKNDMQFEEDAFQENLRKAKRKNR